MRKRGITDGERKDDNWVDGTPATLYSADGKVEKAGKWKDNSVVWD